MRSELDALKRSMAAATGRARRRLNYQIAEMQNRIDHTGEE